MTFKIGARVEIADNDEFSSSIFGKVVDRCKIDHTYWYEYMYYVEFEFNGVTQIGYFYSYELEIADEIVFADETEAD